MIIEHENDFTIEDNDRTTLTWSIMQYKRENVHAYVVKFGITRNHQFYCQGVIDDRRVQIVGDSYASVSYSIIQLRDNRPGLNIMERGINRQGRHFAKGIS